VARPAVPVTALAHRVALGEKYPCLIATLVQLRLAKSDLSRAGAVAWQPADRDPGINFPSPLARRG
jgi:hypothetical protein